MIDASLPFITQLRLLVQPSELRGLTTDLAQTVPPLSQLTRETTPLFANGVRPASSCVANVIIPWSKLTLNDPHFNASNGFPPRPVYVEAVDFLPGPGRRVARLRRQRPLHPGPRDRRHAHLLAPAGAVRAVARAAPGRAAAAAARPEVARRFEPNVPCETQPPITDLSAPTGGPPQQQSSNLSAPGASLRWTSAATAAIPQIQQLAAQDGLKLGTAAMPALAQRCCLPTPPRRARPEGAAMKRAIREHWKDFAAIVGLLVLTIVVAGYILTHERLRFPFIRPRRSRSTPSSRPRRR